MNSFSPVPSDISQTIRNARIVCILFMMTVHIWPGGPRIVAADVPEWQHLFYFVVVDIFGRASVPLLSVFSGLLLIPTYSKSPSLSALLLRKFQSLILPMAFWSAPMVAFFLLGNFVFGDEFDIPRNLMEWLNAFFGITDSPANSPLHFLRDIFVMCFVGSVVILVFDRSKILGWAVALIFLSQELDGDGFILFRNQIGLFFLLGLLLALHGKSAWRPGWGVAVVGFAVGLLITYGNLPSLTPFASEEILRSSLFRAGVSLFMWRICCSAMLMAEPVRGKINTLERYIFTIFCSHSLTIKLFSLAALILGWTENSAAYILLFVAQIPACIAIGVLLSHALRNVSIANGHRVTLRPAIFGGPR